jgi:hypothetical protein
MTSHPRVEILSTYLDSELALQERQRIEAHLEGCEACQHRVEALRAVVGRLSQLERRSPPAHLDNQLKRLAGLGPSPPTLAERLEKGASMFSSGNTLLPLFGVVVALAIIIYLVAFGAQWRTMQEADSPPVDSGALVEIRTVADRVFEREGEMWIERGLGGAAVTDRYGVDELQVEEWLREFPELRELTGLGGVIRLRVENRVVEIDFEAATGQLTPRERSR